MNNTKHTVAMDYYTNPHGVRLYPTIAWPDSAIGNAWAEAPSGNKPKLESWWDSLVAFSTALNDKIEFVDRDKEFMTQKFNELYDVPVEDERVVEMVKGYRAWGERYVFWARFDVSMFGTQMVLEYIPRSPEHHNPNDNLSKHEDKKEE